MAADGSIIINTEIDNKKAQKELDRLNKKIQTLNDQIYVKQRAKMPLVEQSKKLVAQLDAAKAKLEEMKSGNAFYTSSGIQQQQETVKRLQKEWEDVQRKVESYDASIERSTAALNLAKEQIGGIQQQMAATGMTSKKMAAAMEKMQKSANGFSKRLASVVRSALVFTVISQGLASLREWFGKVIKSNDEATAAIARLKGALLTLAQPLVNVVIPAVTRFADILTHLITSAAQFVSTMFGTTAQESAASAENLYNEADALDSVEGAAAKAEKSLASFDQINKLSGSNSGSAESSNIAPDFSAITGNWLFDRMSEVAAWIPTAMIMGGIALVALGSALGNLLLVLSGLTLLGVGIPLATDNEKLASWVDALGLNSVEEFVVVAILLGGIAIVAIGAAMGNLLMVITGLAIIGTTVVYAQQSGMLQDWAISLGLARAAQWITAALMIGGIALIAIGAAMSNILMVLAGLGLLAAGVYVGAQSGTIKSWADTLGLDSVFSYVTAGIQLAGIALIAIGAAMGNLPVVIAGAVILGTGMIVEGIGESTLLSWWETLKLTTVAQWISVALLLTGIALVAIGAAMGNILMVLAGAAVLAFGITAAVNDNHLEDWVTTLGLEKVAGWVTAALLLLGMAAIVFGIVTYNILMLIAGAGLLGAGIAIGSQSGSFQSWVEALHLDEVSGWVSTAMLLAGIALVAIGAMTLNVPMLIAGIALLGGGAALKIGQSTKSFGGNRTGGGFSRSISGVSGVNTIPIPALATGAVIPPNQEFLAVLGDQKSGTNIEAPTYEIESAVMRGIRRAGITGGNQNTAILELDGQQLGKIIYRLNGEQSRRVGVNLVEG